MGKVIIIAEAGVNHNGSLELAKEMVCMAKDAGADYIKFQTFIPDKLVSRYADKAEYQKKAIGKEQSQLQMLEKLALTFDDFSELKKYCDNQNIGFVSTPFDLESIDFLETLNMDFWKVPSGEITNLPYLEKIAHTGRRVIMSTGMCEMQEIHDAVKILESNGAGKITLLHCNTEYPTPFSDVNLRAMLHIAHETGKAVGYSDHTVGIEISVAAVALGAAVIEKHFTLDKNMEGPDHKASLDPVELKQMVSAIRNVEAGLGNEIKAKTESEKKNITVARKSIVAKQAIAKGDILSDTNITVKRPGNGISPMKWHEVLGRKADKDYAEDQLISEDIFV